MGNRAAGRRRDRVRRRSNRRPPATRDRRARARAGFRKGAISFARCPSEDNLLVGAARAAPSGARRRPCWARSTRAFRCCSRSAPGAAGTLLRAAEQVVAPLGRAPDVRTAVLLMRTNRPLGWPRRRRWRSSPVGARDPNRAGVAAARAGRTERRPGARARFAAYVLSEGRDRHEEGTAAAIRVQCGCQAPFLGEKCDPHA